MKPSSSHHTSSRTAPWGVVLSLVGVLLSSGCAGPSAAFEAQAASDLACDEALTVDSEDREHHVVTGCGRTQHYERQCEKVGSYRKSWECTDWVARE